MAVEDPESESKVIDELKLGPEVVAELMSPQEKIFFSRPTEVEKLPTETFVDLSAEPTIEVVPSLIAIRVSLFLRSPDEYDPLQVFLHERVS